MRFKVVPAVKVLLEDEDGKVLLLKRGAAVYAGGLYSLPTGHVDGAESLAEAAAREAEEETGVKIDPADLKLFFISHQVYGTKGVDECITFFFKAGKWQGTPHNAEPHKCDGVSWHDIDDLPEDTLVNTADALEWHSKDKKETGIKTYMLNPRRNLVELTRDRISKNSGPKPS